MEDGYLITADSYCDDAALTETCSAFKESKSVILDNNHYFHTKLMTIP